MIIMSKKESIDYEFELIGEDKFKVLVFLKTTSTQIKRIFNKSAKALGKRKMTSVNPRMDISFVEEIEVRPNYYPLINSVMGNIMSDIAKDCKNIERIIFLDYKVTHILLQKQDDGFWKITVTFEGVYSNL